MGHVETLMGATQATTLAEQLHADPEDTWIYKVVEVGAKGLCKIEVYDEALEYIGIL